MWVEHVCGHVIARLGRILGRPSRTRPRQGRHKKLQAFHDSPDFETPLHTVKVQ